MILIRTAHEQPEQCSEQKASSREAAMVMMVTMAAMTAKDHVPQGQDTKQTQHFFLPPFCRFMCTGHSVRVQDNAAQGGKTGPEVKDTDDYFSPKRKTAPWITPQSLSAS